LRIFENGLKYFDLSILPDINGSPGRDREKYLTYLNILIYVATPTAWTLLRNR
jgi:hypothetical protein